VLAVKLPSPLYVAVMVWLPTERAEVLNVVFPLLCRVPLPSVVDPSLNVTVPVGVPEPGAAAVTVAVNVTDCPKTDGLTDEVRGVVVEAWVTESDPDT